MKKLNVPYFPGNFRPDELPGISTRINLLNKEAIAINPWAEFPYKPAVEFAIAHMGTCIFIKYYVAEKDVKTIYTQINEPVYQDSCVEFFIAVQDDDSYYNFEFNSRGICLAGYGKGRDHRQILSPEVISQISTLRVDPQRGAGKNFRWELCIAFPLTVFCYHDLQDISGKTFSGNFYKCGDHAAEPHFLVWNNILSKEPDFHSPEFFGTLRFDSSAVQNNTYEN